MNWAGAVTLPANQDRLDESKRIQYVLSYKKDVVNPTTRTDYYYVEDSNENRLHAWL